jgi:hypothetical protein
LSYLSGSRSGAHDIAKRTAIAPRRPFAQSGGQLLFHLGSKLYERASATRISGLSSRDLDDFSCFAAVEQLSEKAISTRDPLERLRESATCYAAGGV